MRLNEYEAQFLYQFLGRIDITHIPVEYFLSATILHKRLGQALTGRKGGL